MRIDIVDVRMDIFSKRIVVIHGNFHGNIIFLGRDVDGFFNKPFAGTIEIIHKLFQSFFRIKYLLMEIAIGFFYPLSVIESLISLFRKASSRNRAARISNLNSVVVKIESSGMKVMVVPGMIGSHRFLTSP